ncbi:hypothetical protein [Flagellimonas aequoris]|uniref:DUF4348 domain-containing protein n=1 Tax=Flagellimonas aequoris TaxID=2306997 RepID=A0A418NB36_9FLAO|nr:hypothetical protein [Allomuricauda aequoris]RIV72817.1 hypothetical protein D2U88_04080 [Allomuricauda aequoris]TXK05323.1 hypothetical protein FQ019_04055 [Allomuricauda aequoris]
MKYSVLLIVVVLWGCKVQKINDLAEEYKIVNLVLKEVHVKQFILYDENYLVNYTTPDFNAYIDWYDEFLETGKITSMASRDIEWILDYDDIKFISKKIKSDTIKTKWDRKQIKNPNLIYASDRPDLVESSDLPRPPRVELSKAYINKDRTKAMIIRIIGGNGFLILAKKVDGNWQLCGEIEYMFS